MWDIALGVAGGVLLFFALGGTLPATSSPAAAPVATAAPEVPPSEPAAPPELPPLMSGCTYPENGFGSYGEWRSLDVEEGPWNDVRKLGKLLLHPRAVRPDGTFDLLVHFHGSDAVRKELAAADLPLVVYATDAGTLSTTYGKLLAEPGSFERLLAAIDQRLSALTGRKDARAAHVAVSSWSAGYAAVAKALSQAPERIHALVLLDSLYASYAPNQRDIVAGGLDMYLTAARAAERGGAPFFLTHSYVRTGNYASTREVAAAMLDALGATGVIHSEGSEAAEPAEPGASVPLRVLRRYEKGRLTLRGYQGTQPDDHCAHLRLLKEALREQVLPAFAEK